MQFIIDRFEGDFAVCQNRETKEMLDLDRKLFPSNAKEGDLIEYDDGTIRILDNNALRESIRERMKRLWK